MCSSIPICCWHLHACQPGSAVVAWVVCAFTVTWGKQADIMQYRPQAECGSCQPRWCFEEYNEWKCKKFHNKLSTSPGVIPLSLASRRSSGENEKWILLPVWKSFSMSEINQFCIDEFQLICCPQYVLGVVGTQSNWIELKLFYRFFNDSKTYSAVNPLINISCRSILRSIHYSTGFNFLFPPNPFGKVKSEEDSCCSAMKGKTIHDCGPG